MSGYKFVLKAGIPSDKHTFEELMEAYNRGINDFDNRGMVDNPYKGVDKELEEEYEQGQADEWNTRDVIAHGR